MRIAAAQINCTVGKIQQNLDEHYRMIEIAIKHEVQLISFPELSITGYCRDEGRELVFTINDSRIKKLQELSTQGNIIIVTGAPITINQHLYIGSLIINPAKPIDIYTKQYLHDGEELFYDSSMDYNPIIELETERISFAICADINNENHPFQAQQNNCSIYLPSIFYSTEGMDKGHNQLEEYANKYSLNVLVSNYSGELWGMKSGGKSAFWNANGELIDNFNPDDSGILVVEKIDNKWKSEKLIETLD
jgi:predicted amidohydrolase